MADDIDNRPIESIPFASHIASASARNNVRGVIACILRDASVKTAQDLIELGCTGLTIRLPVRAQAIQDATLVRENMAGAGFGLPCYVPPNRFCVVHNVIGGLQPNQVQRHAEGVEVCSRPLTPEEKAHASGMLAFVANEGAKEAKEHFGAERVDSTEAPAEPAPTSGETGMTRVLKDGFRCPEHTITFWACRYCLAALILNGPLEPETFAEVSHGKDQDNTYLDDLAQLPELLETTPGQSVRVFVCVKRWTRKLVED